MDTLLTDRQWLFLERYAIAHKTTLAAIAEHVTGAAAPAPRGVTRKACTGVDRKFAKDRQRCADAIGILERVLDSDDHRACSHNSKHAGQCREANHAELRRLQAAMENPKLLWTIYRRADRGAGYGITVAPARARKAA